MRLDRFITLQVVRRLRRERPSRTARRLPILMYHSISDDLEEGVGGYYRVATSPERFAQQMQWLSDLGIKGVSLEDALASRNGDDSDHTRQVAITFDDGFRDVYSAAYPVLARHGFSATIYLPTHFINETRRAFKKRECMTWTEVGLLHRAGIKFGSHTVNHPKLVDLDWTEIARELSESRAKICESIDQDVQSFAYPYAFPQANERFALRFKQELIDAGYTSCVTTTIGRSDAEGCQFQLPRLPINSLDDRKLFEAKIAGAYDWMSEFQLLYKKSRHLMRKKN